MTKKLTVDLPTLVLNKGWAAFSIMPVKKAITKVMSDMAKILDPETNSLYSFEEWMDFDVKIGNPFIQTCSKRVRVPEIIVLTTYDKIPQREVKLTRRNLLIRDNYTCQYTGVKLNMSTATMDHIVPRSRGGKTNWTNLVMCCLDINAKKADRTPSEAGLSLLKKPIKPKWSPIYARFARLTASNVYPSWSNYLNIEGLSFGE